MKVYDFILNLFDEMKIDVDYSIGNTGDSPLLNEDGTVRKIEKDSILEIPPMSKQAKLEAIMVLSLDMVWIKRGTTYISVCDGSGRNIELLYNKMSELLKFNNTHHSITKPDFEKYIRTMTSLYNYIDSLIGDHNE